MKTITELRLLSISLVDTPLHPSWRIEVGDSVEEDGALSPLCSKTPPDSP